MFKKSLLIFFIFLFSFLFKSETYSSNVLVEDIFSDIWSDYKYLNELQTLYNNDAIKLNSNWKFNPYQLLTRGDFIWINQSISCKSCMQPNVDNYYVSKYTLQSFFDVDKTNENFYCVEESLSNNYIKGYYQSTVCDDGTFKDWFSPFCPNNTIILEEALAIVLRVSWILTNEEAAKIRQDIYDWKITNSLSSDVHPKNLDWSVYSFYPDFMKALNYEIIEYDNKWNKKTYTLIDLVWNKLEPKRSITREEFLRIAHTTFKANSCINKVPEDLALKMDILNKTCIESDINCTSSLLISSEYTYDFKWNIWLNNDSNGSYIWNFYNNNTGEEIIKYDYYIDNFTFPSDWDWLINLKYTDDDWKSSEVYNTLSLWKSILNQSYLNSYIIPSWIIWDLPFILNLEWYSTWWEWKHTFEWEFWDWTKWFWSKNTYIYKQPWVYIIKLKVTDEKWNTSKSNIAINVHEKNKINVDINISKWGWELIGDFDSDWIDDLVDDCPLLFWKIENNWCPIYESSCKDDKWCLNWFKCNLDLSWFWVCIPLPIWNSCNYTGWNLIYWSSICNVCPCSNSLDFLSSLRKCDVIFPAILSPNNKDIYWQWKFYQIK